MSRFLRVLTILGLALPAHALAQAVLPGPIERIALPDYDPAPERSYALVGADVDGDGRDELVAHAWPARLLVYRALPGGQLAAPDVHPLPAGSGAMDVGLAAGDLDGDGRDDIVISEGGTLQVALARADGGWTVRTLETSGTQGRTEPILADLDRDGHLDILRVEQEIFPHLINVGAQVSVHFGDGRGGVRRRSVQAIGLTTVLDVELADLDGDQLPDLVLRHRPNGIGPGPSGLVEVRHGRGGGGFAEPLPVGLGHVVQLKVADFTGDGRPDIIAGHPSAFFAAQMRTYLLVNTGGDWHNAPPRILGATGKLGAIAAGDLDGDGRADLVSYSEHQPAIQTYLQSGGDLQAPEWVPAEPGQIDTFDPGPSALAIIDLDGDGLGEVAFAQNDELLRARAVRNPHWAPAALPPAPVLLSATTDYDDTSVSVVVQRLPAGGALPVLGYRIGTDPGGPHSPRLPVEPGTGNLTFGSRDLDMQRDYTVTVRAYNAAGYGPPSNAIVVRREPEPALSWPERIDFIEGDTGSEIHFVPATLNVPAPEGGVTFDITGFANLATPEVDYRLPTTTGLHIPAGQTRVDVPVEVVGDTEMEPHETVMLRMVNVRGARAAAGSQVFINDNEPRPQGPGALGIISGDMVVEGDPGESRFLRFDVFLRWPRDFEVTVDVEFDALLGDTGATNGVDFDSTPIRDIRFAPGETLKTFTVEVYGDDEDEYTETVLARLVNARNGEPNRPWVVAAATIRDDDKVLSTKAARADRFVLSQNLPAAVLNLIANDTFVSEEFTTATLVLDYSAGEFWTANADTPDREDNYTVFKPKKDFVGEHRAYYHLCEDYMAGARCLRTPVDILIRPIAEHLLSFEADADAGFHDVPLERMGPMPDARFEPTPLVAPEIVQATIGVDDTPHTPWDGARAGVHVLSRWLPVPADGAPRAWRALVEAFAPSGGDVDLYVGVDVDGDGQADEDEVRCTSAMAPAQEACELDLAQAGDAEAGYWMLLHNRGAAPLAVRAELAPVPLVAGDGSLVATGPGTLAAGHTGALRLAWDDAGFLPGERRIGYLRVRRTPADAGGLVPVRIERVAGEPAARALVPERPLTLRLGAGQAHERLFIDVPEGAAALAVELDSAQQVDLYVSRTPPAAGPAVAPAPSRGDAIAVSATPGGMEQVLIEGTTLAPGRWYVTPVHTGGGSAQVRLQVQLVAAGTAPAVGSYFNPERAGHGLFLYPAASQWVGLWYTYFQDGSPTWLYLQGARPEAGRPWRPTVYRAAWNGGAARLVPVGEAVALREGEQGLRFTYRVDGETGSEPLSPLGRGCPSLDGQALDASSHWFNPARAGTGYSVQLFPNYEFHTAFVYDLQGVPRFLVAEGGGFGGTQRILPLVQLTGFCPLCERSGNPVRREVGTFLRRYGIGTAPRFESDAIYLDGVPGFWTSAEDVGALGGPGSTQGCEP